MGEDRVETIVPRKDARSRLVPFAVMVALAVLIIVIAKVKDLGPL